MMKLFLFLLFLIPFQTGRPPGTKHILLKALLLPYFSSPIRHAPGCVLEILSQELIDFCGFDVVQTVPNCSFKQDFLSDLQYIQSSCSRSK